MNDTNPEIEANLDELANVCCAILAGKANDHIDRRDRLLKSLLMSGYVWKKQDSFQADLERRVKSRCRDSAMHRGGALSSLSVELATKFENLARWESRTPDDGSPSKPANISSATDS